MRYLLIVSIVISSAIAIISCSAGEFTHLDAKQENKVVFGDGSDDLGIEGIMPTIGKIYIDSVTVGGEDGGEDEMLKAHLNYELSADIVVDNYTTLKTGAKCEWSTSANDVKFTDPLKDNAKVSTLLTDLKYDEKNDTYNCVAVKAELKKTGKEANYDPDSLVTVAYKGSDGKYITAVGTDATFISRINLNTADRHNIITVATSPSTVLFHRRDGLFQAGFTAYRGMLGLPEHIGSAMYEARVRAPGATTTVAPGTITYSDEELQADKKRMQAWLDNSSNIDTDESEAAFVASYGPPIALPAFRKDPDKTIDYRKLRIALLRHNNYPIIISHDKKMYTMGSITWYNPDELKKNYPYFIRQNDNWFAYSGVDVPYNTNDFYSKLHVGEIKPEDGSQAKFVTVISITSDLDTTLALDEISKEYYIAGNPHWNKNFCTSGATYDATTTGFTYNYQCLYASGRKVGAKKIVGLQAKLGDGTGAIATDNEIFFIGRDGKGYKIDIRPDGINGDNIRNGIPVVSELVTWNDKLPADQQVSQELADTIYVKDMSYANMNHAVAPTMLLSDGSIVFTIRTAVNNGDNVTVGHVAQRFFINKNGLNTNIPGHPDNVRMVKLLGPSSAYGEDGNIYYFTDVPALGVSYAPENEYYAKQVQGGANGDFGNPLVDYDYLAFIYGDPIQFFDFLNNNEKSIFFRLTYGKIDIDSDIKRIAEKHRTTAQALGSNFAFLPYNPLTGQVENFLKQGNGSYQLQTVAYRPFRTNSHLFVNMNANADNSYISVPHYFYGYNWSGNLIPSEWSYRKGGLMAAEVKHGNISKVFGTLKSPEIPFRYTPYGRNTTFFANKVGIFSFVDYNVRKTRSICSDNGANAVKCKTYTGNTGEGLYAANSGALIIADNSTNFPDYFYVGKSGTTWIDGEASGVNNYISTPLVRESRMSNYPDTRNYAKTGFQPQLLSSWYSYEFDRLPSTNTENNSSYKDLPGYILSYWYDNISSRYSADGGANSEKEKYFKDNITNFLKYTYNGAENHLYQYAYGVGEYRYYAPSTTPVWRARKLNTEVLQYQTRYGTLVPLSHGKAFGELSSLLVPMFYMNDYIKGDGDGLAFVSQRKYMTGLYGFYDRDAIMNKTDLGANVFGSIITPLDNMTTNKIGYVADKGNYMWRNKAIETEGVGSVALDAFPFVNYVESK